MNDTQPTDAHNASITAELEEHAKALLAKQTRIEIFQKQLAADRENRILAEQMVKIEGKRANEAQAALRPLVDALKILLASRKCWSSNECEIPEELSAQFDITLDEARSVCSALAKWKE